MTELLNWTELKINILKVKKTIELGILMQFPHFMGGKKTTWLCIYLV